MWRSIVVLHRAIALFAVLSCGIVCVLKCPSAYADGVVLRKRTTTEVGRTGKMVVSPRQEALITCTDGKIRVTLRTSFQAVPSDVAWVIPVPHPPDRVEKADDAIFAKLEQLTAPRFYEVTPSISIGCSHNRDSPEEVGRIAVTETGKAGIYDYKVLTATGTQVLVKWLNDHSYHIPDGSEAVFKGYVDRGWCWLAIRLDAERVDQAMIAPHPIQYTYRDSQCIYPLIISQISADAKNEILLYVLSTHSYGCENWPNWSIPAQELRLDDRSASGTNYEKLFQSLTERAGGHLFVPEYMCPLNQLPDPETARNYVLGLVEQVSTQAASESNELYLTRLRAIVRREAMDRDVVLVPREYNHWRIGDLYVQSLFFISNEQRDSTSVVVVLLAALLLSVVYLIHRRWRKKRDVLVQ